MVLFGEKEWVVGGWRHLDACGHGVEDEAELVGYKYCKGRSEMESGAMSGIETNICEEQPFRSIRALATRSPGSCERLIQIPDLGTCPV